MKSTRSRTTTQSEQFTSDGDEAYVSAVEKFLNDAEGVGYDRGRKLLGNLLTEIEQKPQKRSKLVDHVRNVYNTLTGMSVLAKPKKKGILKGNVKKASKKNGEKRRVSWPTSGGEAGSEITSVRYFFKTKAATNYVDDK